MSKSVVTKIQLRYDTLANWLKTDTAGKGGNYIPLSGEVCIASIPSGTTTDQSRMDPPQVMMKVGDGKTTFSNLPWASANAADVYSWAKLSLDEFKEQVLSDYQAKLTDAQVLAINSGITADKVATYDGYATDIAKGVAANTALNGHTVKSDVPENAVFTDTTYTLGGSDDKVTLTPKGGAEQSVTVNNVAHATKADAADKLATARTITISGDASSSAVSFDGSDNIEISVDVKKAAALDSVSVGGETVPVYFDADGKPQAITSYSGNAASATKAEQDGKGNVIADTYVKKSGDTMTGSLNMNAGFDSTSKDGNYLAALTNASGNIAINLENNGAKARIQANPSTESDKTVLIKSEGVGYDLSLAAVVSGNVNGSFKVSNGHESLIIEEDNISLSSDSSSVAMKPTTVAITGKEGMSFTSGSTTASMPMDKGSSETIAMVSDITAAKVGLDKVVNAAQDSTPTADSTNYVTSGGVKSYVDTAVSTMAKFQYKVVTELPTASKDTMGVIYLIAHSHVAGDGYDEYITLSSGESYSWEKIGNTDIDLSEYTKTADYKSLSFGVEGNLDAYDPVTAKTIKLKGSEGTSVSFDKKTGTFTISSSIYGLQAASSTDLGGVKLVDDTRLKDTPNDRKAVAGKTYAVQLDGDDKMVVNVPWNYREIKAGVLSKEAETVLSSDSTLPLTVRVANEKHLTITGKPTAGDIILETGDDVLLATDVLILNGGSSTTNVD